MFDNRETDPDREPSMPRKNRQKKFILKAVLKGAAKVYAIYRFVSKLVSWFEKLLVD